MVGSKADLRVELIDQNDSLIKGFNFNLERLAIRNATTNWPTFGATLLGGQVLGRTEASS